MATTITDRLGVAPGSPAYGNDLSAIEALSGVGLLARTGSEAWALRVLETGNAGIALTYGDGVSGNPTLALANDLSALEGLSSTGIAVRSASDTWVQRTITGTSNQITVTNGDGVSGNPTIAATVASQAEAEAGTDTTKLMTAQRVAQAIAALGGGGGAGGPMFNCRLTKVSSNLQLDRFAGKYLFINGTNETIPSGGVTLGASGLTADTLYYIYVYMNAGTMALEASTTGWAIDSTYGHPIKSGDATRTLVGMARPVSGPAWQDSASQRLVVSYWNRRLLPMLNWFTASRSTGSSSWVEVNSEIRLQFLCWADTACQFGGNGLSNINTGLGYAGLGIDSTSVAEDFGGGGNISAGGINTPWGGVLTKTLSEGFHYATLLAKNTAFNGSATAGPEQRQSLNAGIWG